MSKVVRILLGIAFLIFLAGVVWSFWAISQREEIVTTPPPAPDTTITTSITSPPPKPAITTPPPTGVVNKPAQKKTRPQRYFVTETVYYEYPSASSASAWARSGVNPDGSTYAEAHAQ